MSYKSMIARPSATVSISRIHTAVQSLRCPTCGATGAGATTSWDGERGRNVARVRFDCDHAVVVLRVVGEG